MEGPRIPIKKLGLLNMGSTLACQQGRLRDFCWPSQGLAHPWCQTNPWHLQGSRTLGAHRVTFWARSMDRNASPEACPNQCTECFSAIPFLWFVCVLDLVSCLGFHLTHKLNTLSAGQKTYRLRMYTTLSALTVIRNASPLLLLGAERLIFGVPFTRDDFSSLTIILIGGARTVSRLDG